MQADFLLSEPPGKPTMSSTFCQSNFLKRKFFFTSFFLETLLVLFWDIRSPWSDLCIPLSILDFYFCCLYNSSDLEHPTLHLFMPFCLRIPLPVMSCLPCLQVKLVIHNFPSTRKLSLRELPILSFVLPNVLYCFRTYFFTCQSFLRDGALVQSPSHVWLCDFMDCSRPGFCVLYYLPFFSQIHVHWVDGAIQPSHSLSPPSPPALSLPSIRVFFSESALCIRWPKYWSFSFIINPANEYSGLISFGIHCFDLLAVQGTLKSLLQHHSSKTSILLLWAFFIFQLAHPYMTTGKTIALTIWTFVGKVMFLLFNMLPRFVTASLPRSKHLFISWLQSLWWLILCHLDWAKGCPLSL